MPNLIRLESILAQNLKLHKAKINCISQMIIGLITAQSSNLKKIARHFPNTTQIESNYRRIQRFLAETEIDEHQIASLIYNLFGLDKVTLTIDRTNWKWGKSNLNIFMLAVVHQGIAIPLYWTMLDKRGNSSTLERTELIEKFIHNFGKDKIVKILADREFVGKEWFNWFTTEHLKFAIRIKKDSKVFNSNGESVQIHTLFHNLSQQQTYHHDRTLMVDDCSIKVSAKLDSDNDYVIVATNDFDDDDAMATYAKRWQIETLFSCFKGRGFNLEDTHLTIQDRVSKLVAITALAFCWAYQAGLVKLSEKPNHYKRRPKTNGRPQASIFAIGLDCLIDGFRRFIINRDYAIFNQLLRFLSGKHLPNLVQYFCRVQSKFLFNTDTVDKMLQHLMENGIKVKAGDCLGKTIIYAVNQRHGEFIAERFNHHYPNYQGKFARIITHAINHSQTLIDDFSKKDLPEPQIAISVDMLDTGIDVPEVVNLVFFKAVRSKVKFLQMIGRGTRLCKDLFAPEQDKPSFIFLTIVKILNTLTKIQKGHLALKPKHSQKGYLKLV